MSDGALAIAGRGFRSRLIVGTGKYATFQQMAKAVAAAGAEMVTVAIRRVDFDGNGRHTDGAIVGVVHDADPAPLATEGERHASISRS